MGTPRIPISCDYAEIRSNVVDEVARNRRAMKNGWRMSLTGSEVPCPQIGQSAVPSSIKPFIINRLFIMLNIISPKALYEHSKPETVS